MKSTENATHTGPDLGHERWRQYGYTEGGLGIYGVHADLLDGTTHRRSDRWLMTADRQRSERLCRCSLGNVPAGRGRVG